MLQSEEHLSQGIGLPGTKYLIDAAGRWFLNSGIQEEHGGVARYYRTDLGQNATVSTEITGYSVSALLFIHQRTGQGVYLDAAVKAARFLTRYAWNPRLRTFPFEHSSNGDHSRALTYFFDCGIIVRGLLAAWHATQDAEFRDTAVLAGRTLLADFPAAGTIHPILTLPDKLPLAHQPRWSASPGCYQLKAALAWFELFECTGDADFQHAYESALERTVSTEMDFLPGDANCERVMDRLHPYAYFLEGLLPVLDRPECAAIFRAGLDRAAAYLREIAPQFVRSDVYAQVLRARLFGESIAGIPLDSAAAAHEAQGAAAFQLESDDPRLAGGFGFGRKTGQLLPYANPVSTAFAVQALAMWSDRNNNAPQVSRQALI